MNANNDINNREAKLHQNACDITFDNKKDISLNSTENNYKISNSNNFNTSLNNFEYQQVRNITLNSIDDKYKNLENPFTSPDLPKRPEEERRARIIERMNRDRKKKFQSKSVDSGRNQNISNNYKERLHNTGNVFEKNNIFGEDNYE